MSQIALLAPKPRSAGSRSRNSTHVADCVNVRPRAVEDLALAFRASLLVRAALPAVADALPWRLSDARGRVCGTVPAGGDAE